MSECSVHKYKRGDEVRKISGKPFKSKLKKNTIKSTLISPYTGNLAVTFYEDDSVVEGRMLFKNIRPEDLP